MTEHALPCIVCRTPLESAFNNTELSDLDNQPYGGLAFQSLGHYGGTVFDPMDGTYLEVSICDPCLVQAGEENLVIHGIPVHLHVRTLDNRTRWTREPDEQDER